VLSRTHRLCASQSFISQFFFNFFQREPYEDKTSREVIEMLDRGERLNQPAGCPDAMYSLMSRCWHANPRMRPTFVEIYQYLQNITSNDSEFASPLRLRRADRVLVAPPTSGEFSTSSSEFSFTNGDDCYEQVDSEAKKVEVIRHSAPRQQLFNSSGTVISRRVSLQTSGLLEIVKPNTPAKKSASYYSGSDDDLSEMQKQMLDSLAKEIFNKRGNFLIFYEKLFELNPETRALFANITVEEQSMKFLGVSCRVRFCVGADLIFD
jgi:hypothetical protein